MAAIDLLAIIALPVVSSVPAARGNSGGDALDALRRSLTDPDKMDLGNSNLSGQLVPELVKLGHLQYLELYKNKIQGAIPAELGNLKSLISLDLYNNNISGTIPQSLGNLKSLVFLVSLWLILEADVSNNNLCGTIPTIGSFGHIPLNKYSPKVRVVSSGLIRPNDLVFYVRLETYRRPRAPIKLGDLRFLSKCLVSGWIRIGDFDNNGNFVSIRRYEMKDLSELIKMEMGKLTQQPSEEELEHLKMFWFDGENSGFKFMAHQGVKHSFYFCDENLEYKQVHAYYNKVNSLASQFFDGGDFDIRNVMKYNDLRLGEYYNGKKLLEVLKNAYGEYLFVGFKKEV
ncbi:hypothetical protein OROHE_014269 [Orobanche hederae]